MCVATLTGEEKMWRSVVCLAVRDASTPDELLTESSELVASLRDRIKARACIFNHDSDYFHHICLIAGTNIEKVREVARKLIQCDVLLSRHAIHSAIYGDRADWMVAINDTKNRHGQEYDSVKFE